MKMKLTEEIWKEGNMYVSYCPELDIASCGQSIEKARKNLREVIMINVEETEKIDTFDKLIKEAGFYKDQHGVLLLRKEL
jgi:predicted RNase H-like HicB family nuclease